MSKYVSFQNVGRMALSMMGISNLEWLQVLQGLPSIDIVRCGECEYSEKTSSPITALWCKRFGLKDMAVEADDFCSYGVRKESE